MSAGRYKKRQIKGERFNNADHKFYTQVLKPFLSETFFSFAPILHFAGHNKNNIF